MTLPETVDQYSQKAAEDFIQTAVFVDDRLYQRDTQVPGQPRSVAAPPKRKKAIKSAENNVDSGSLTLADEDDAAPDAFDIVNSFAKKQIVCSLYQPKRDAKVSANSAIFPLCKAADIVIVDWDLHGDRGKRATELVDGLFSQAVQDVPEQLRLILVYTQEINLFGIASQLYDQITKSLTVELELLKEDGGLAFHTANSRVVVLGKPGRERAGVEERFVVEETDLADVAVHQFSKLASGLLHAASLLGLAKIRENSRKVLSKFNNELDPAFLAHHALLPAEDASAHIISLLIAEIEAVLEDALDRPLLPPNLLKDWCHSVWEPGDHVNSFLDQDQTARGLGEAVLLQGFKEAKASGYSQLPKTSPSAKIRSAASLFATSADDPTNHKFSHLVTSRTFYGDVPRVLSLGTVICRQSDESYFLCLQPVCDSVRLTDETNFLFVELQVDDETGKGLASHVVVKPNADIVELLFQPKSYHCAVIRFKPSSGRDQVIAKPNEQDGFLFKDTHGEVYDWVDQLKPAFAQRAVSKLASDLSRVGLTESEWLRNLEKK